MDLGKLSDDDIAELASRKLINAEKKLADADEIYTEIVRRMDVQAGDFRDGDMAKYALRMRSAQETIGGHARCIKGIHAELSILQCDVADIPMTRGGER